MSEVFSQGSSLAIWKRAIEPEAGNLSPSEAQALLALKLAKPDLERADALAAKARAGQLTLQENQELNNFQTLGTVMEFFKSKARLSLRQQGAAK